MKYGESYNAAQAARHFTPVKTKKKKKKKSSGSQSYSPKHIVGKMKGY